MKEILTNKNESIKVSDEDYPILSKYTWYISQGYAINTTKKCSMHRFIYTDILKIDIPKKHVIDHIDNNRINNCRENLRIVTSKENSRNRKKKENTSSKYIGVTLNYKIWSSTIIVNGKELYASYKNEHHAAHQYNLWCKEYNITTANLNIIPDELITDFEEYIKTEKRGDNLPTGINLTDSNKYLVQYRRKRHGVYENLDDAIKVINNLTLEYENAIEKEKKDNLPILRNKDGQAIIELFNRKKVKVGETIVDDDKYNDLKKYSWYMNNNYVKAHFGPQLIQIHRYIMDYTGDDFIDHINNNPLDNRKCNLRIATPKENNRNRNKIKKENTTSKFIGINFDKSRNKWRARIKVNNKEINLGRFDTEELAAKARDKVTKEHFGEFGNLNFPES